jgi:hypothetical protein
MRLAVGLAFAAVVVLSGCDLLGGKECSVDDDCHGSKVCSPDGACVECNGDGDCDARETCVDTVCERGGVGEGEGDAGEGEGDAGEGEGDVGEGEGEGEGDVGEGEGEGEGDGGQLVVELTWSDANDLDVHVTKANPSFCIPSSGATASAGGLSGVGPFSQECTVADDDCNYTNCKAGSPGAVEWDGVTGQSAGDPILEQDATSNGSPSAPSQEIVDVAALGTGTYLVSVVEYSDSGTGLPTTSANITVTSRGSLQSQIFITEGAEGEWHDVALVHVSSAGNVCVADVSDGVDECE